MSERLPVAPAGWYPDPATEGALRYWDGERWTDHRAVRSAPSGTVREWRQPELPTLGLGGLRVAAVGLIGGIVCALGASFAVYRLGGVGAQSVAVVLTSLVVLWVWLVGAAVVASRRYGSGDLRADFGLRWEWFDALRGLGANLTARFITAVVAIPLVAAGAAASNTSAVSAQQASTIGLVAVGAGAVIGAPIVEELFFRGLLLRTLASRWPFGWAVVAQALVFGFAHANPALGWRTLTVVAITATFGWCQGVFARRWSLGPLMVSHGLFNLLPVLLIALR